MAFAGSSNGIGFTAGHFLADDEGCTRVTATVPADHALVKTLEDGGKYVPAGAVIPANDATAKGILYEDIDVTKGAAPGSIVTAGVIYGDKLPAALTQNAATALTGIKVVTAPNIVRPAIFAVFDSLSVASAAGSASGKTKLTVTGHDLANGQSYVYKTHATTAPAVKLADDVSAWTAWNGTDDVTATTGHKITVAVKDANGQAVAGGSTDVTSKA